MLDEVEDEPEFAMQEEITYIECIDHEDHLKHRKVHSFVAIRPIATGFDQFHLYKVIEKRRATEYDG